NIAKNKKVTNKKRNKRQNITIGRTYTDTALTSNIDPYAHREEQQERDGDTKKDLSFVFIKVGYLLPSLRWHFVGQKP
ncbi:unnamed protein product, partial [Allacma fusca]